MNGLGDLRMQAANFKAILSNEIFRIKQNYVKERRSISDLYDGIIELLNQEQEKRLSRLQVESGSLLTEISESMDKVDSAFNARWKTIFMF